MATKGIMIPRRQLHRLYQEAKDGHEPNVEIRTTGTKLIAKVGKNEIIIDGIKGGK